MKTLNFIKGFCCALLFLSSQQALAVWDDIQNDINISNSRAVFDRVNRVFLVYVTLENTGTTIHEGPFRVLLEDASIPVIGHDGETEDGVPYVEMDISSLNPGESKKVAVNFELQRKQLTFTARLQNDLPGWALVWSDEFDGSAIDSNKWTHEVNCNGGGNQEKQCYTDSEENSFVDNGVLNIVAKQATGQPLPYSSARLVSKNKGDWTYGRFEIRAKAPRGQGSWPAIWMLPTDNVYGGWPHSGEIDIFESVNLGVPLNDGSGNVESHVHGTLHYGQAWPNNDRSGLSYSLPDGANPADDFHVYAIEWEEGEMRWYVDGVLYQTQLKSEAAYNSNGDANGLLHRGWYTEQNGELRWDNSPFDERFHMILNFAVGGSWPEAVNQGGVDAGAFTGTNVFEIDYVRVYECEVAPDKGQGCATVEEGYLEPIAEGGTLNEGAAPTPVAPSDGIERELIIFDNALNEAWPAWDCCGGTQPTIELDDQEHAEVIEFVVGSSPTVLGFNTNFADQPMPYDGSPLLDTGVLEFDLKLVIPPNNTAAGWNLKVEQGGTASEATVSIPTPSANWQHYSIPLKTLSDAGLNLNGIDVVMIFPDWGQGEGAVYRVDNLTILKDETDSGGGSDSGMTPLDFESDGFGATGFTWSVFENVDNPALEFVSNPDTTGINDSATVAKIIARAGGAPWVGTETAHGDIGPFTLDASNSTIKVMVYKSVISDVGVKFAIANGGAQPEIKVANTLVNQWEELTFDFSGYIGLFEAIDIDQIIIFPDFDLAGRTQDNTVYFDNIRFFGDNSDGGDGGDGGSGGSGDELLANGGFDEGTNGWIGAVNVVSDNGNNVFYADVQAAGNPWDVNLSQVMTLIPDTTYILTFRAKASLSRTILAGLGLNHDPWTNVTETVGLGTEWQSFSYTFTTTGFGDDNSRVLFDLGAEIGAVYIDDVSVTLAGDTGGDGGNGGDGGSDSGIATLDFEPDGFGAAGFTWSVFENADNPALEFVSNPDTTGINDSSTVAKIIARAGGAPWVGTESAHGDIGPFTLDASNSTIKVMVYKSVISDVGVKFAIANGGAQPEIKVANTLVNQWEELTFDFSGYIGLFEAIDIDQIIIFPDFDLAGRTQDNTVYFDNIRFGDENDGGDNGGGNNPDLDPNWSLVWSDEFDGSSIDLSKWEHEVNCNGGGNQEKQCYTNSPENSFVENGTLKIVAKPATGQPLPYTSARLRTKYQGDWTYGRIEVRAKPPQGQGSFPAIWMLPTDEVFGGWPHSGEIDIFESVNLKTVDAQGHVEAKVHGNLWYGRSWPNQSNSGAEYELPGDENPADGFHTYAIEWEEGEIRWYVDGVLYQTQLKSEVIIDSDGDANGLMHRGWFTDFNGEFLWDNSPFNQDFHIILNFAVGGNWAENVNNGGIDASAFNDSNAFEFDYVRVYQCSISPNSGQGCAAVTDSYLDPIDQGGTLVTGDAPTPIKPSTGEPTDLIVFENTENSNWPAWNCCGDAAPEVVLDDAEHSEVVEFSIGADPTVVGFNTTIAAEPMPYDGSPMLDNGVLSFDLKLVTPPNNANAPWSLKVEQGGTSSEAIVSIETPTDTWQRYEIPLKTLNNAGLNLNGIDVIMIFPEWGQGEGTVFRVDNVTILEGESDGGDNGDGGSGGDTGSPGVELLSNGGFDLGTENWIGAVNVISDDGNNVFYADVQAAGNPWDVNLSQIMTLIPNETYVLSFRAKASVARSIIAGLGLNHDPWTNVTETVSLSTEWQSFSFIFTTTGFGDDNSRVLFDLGAEIGAVYIDDVSVVIQDNNSGGPVEEDEFWLISATGQSDIDFSPDTVGEWSTGTQIQGDVVFEGLTGWELTSSSNTPEQGNWGTVLAFQNGITGDFSLFNKVELKIATLGNYAGGYKVAISANGVNKEFSLAVNEAVSGWQTVSLDAGSIPLNLSSIDWIAVYGIGGQMGVSRIYVTDFRLVKDEVIPFSENREGDFVFISSDPEVVTDLIVDGDNNSAVGNVIFGEWSTGTGISSTTYNGLDAFALSAGGSWGAVLAMQGDISDGTNIDNYDVDFSAYTNIRFSVASEGSFERYAVAIVSKVGNNETSQEVGFTLASQTDWNQIDIDLGMYGVDLANVSQVAVFGVYAGGSAAQRLYLTDMIMYDSGKITPTKDSSDEKFVYFSSTGEPTDMIFDGDNFAHNGNVEFSDWSTGTTFSDNVQYNGLNAFELTRGSGSWGAVLSLMGDINGGVMEYSYDVAQYSTLNLKIAALGAFSEYTLDFVVDGAEFKVPLSVNSNWSDISIDLSTIPLNLSKLTQIAVFGVGGGAGNKIYLTDFNISK